MKFIPYTDENGQEHFFDAGRVMFTMTQYISGPHDDVPNRMCTKIAMNENMGFILADEEPASIIARIKEAVGIG